MQFNKSVLGLIFLYILLSGCSNYLDPAKVNVDKEIDALKSDEDIKVYLEGIYELDQRARKQESDAVTRYGHDSQEHKDSWKEIHHVDKQNLERIEKLLKKIGHPEKEKVGRYAADTPWLVIHHIGDYDAKVRNFNYLYQAYQKEDLDEGKFALYLNRMHLSKFGAMITPEGSFKESDRINDLIEKLGLKINE